eukprot:364457-Chlamydomonas_euryale.AAC.6
MAVGSVLARRMAAPSAGGGGRRPREHGVRRGGWCCGAGRGGPSALRATAPRAKLAAGRRRWSASFRAASGAATRLGWVDR